MFKIDDAVILTSGGPAMKVIGFSPSGRIWCEWQCTDGLIKEASFFPEMLHPPHPMGIKESGTG